MDLSIGFIYWLYLFHLVALFICLIYGLQSERIQYSSSQQSQSVFLTSQKGTPLHFSQYTYPTFSWTKIFCFPLRHHSCLIKLTLLQLHHHTLLIKLTNVASSHHIPYTCPLIKLTVITSLHHNCYTGSISKLHHSNIISHCSVTTHLIPSDFQLVQLKFIFIYSLKHSLHIPSYMEHMEHFETASPIRRRRN